MNLVNILKTSGLTILLLWKMFALNFLLDFEWLRFCSLFSEDRVCRAVHSSRFQWKLSETCQNIYEFWKKKVVSKWRLIRQKTIFLLTFKLKQFQDKKFTKSGIVRATVLTRVEYSGVLLWTFLWLGQKFWISLACPAAHGSVSKKKVFPEKKSLISELFDFKIQKLVQNGTFGDELFEKQCFQYDHVMSLHGWWLWIWRWVEFNLTNCNLINSVFLSL